MLINYFDLGLHKGQEIPLFIKICETNNWEYQIYGFEAHPDYCKTISEKYKANKNIQIINKAITDTPGKIKLFLANSNGGEGNSIFRTKNNVTDQNVIVEGIRFSDWIKKNIPNFKSQTNVMRFNIEGAEWHLMQDLINNDMYKYFKVICGSTPDIPKVAELRDKLSEYNNLLIEHGIIVHRFTYVHEARNSDIAKLIKSK